MELASKTSHTRSKEYASAFLENVVRPLQSLDGGVVGMARLPLASSVMASTSAATYVEQALEKKLGLGAARRTERADLRRSNRFIEDNFEDTVGPDLTAKWVELLNVSDEIYNVSFLDELVKIADDDEEEEGEVNLDDEREIRGRLNLGNIGSSSSAQRMRAFKALAKDCPFYELAKMMITQLLFWRHTPSGGEESKRKMAWDASGKDTGRGDVYLSKDEMYPLNRDLCEDKVARVRNANYFLVAQVWFAFLRPFLTSMLKDVAVGDDKIPVMQHIKSWKHALLTGRLGSLLEELRDLPYFWWSTITEVDAVEIRKAPGYVYAKTPLGDEDLEKDTLTNMRGLVFYLIRQVYSPMLSLAERLGSNRDEPFVPALGLLNGVKRRRFETLITLMLGVLCFKGEDNDGASSLRKHYIQQMSDFDDAILNDRTSETIRRFEDVWRVATVLGRNPELPVRLQQQRLGLQSEWDAMADDDEILYMLAIRREVSDEAKRREIAQQRRAAKASGEADSVLVPTEFSWFMTAIGRKEPIEDGLEDLRDYSKEEGMYHVDLSKIPTVRWTQTLLGFIPSPGKRPKPAVLRYLLKNVAYMSEGRQDLVRKEWFRFAKENESLAALYFTVDYKTPAAMRRFLNIMRTRDGDDASWKGVFDAFEERTTDVSQTLPAFERALSQGESDYTPSALRWTSSTLRASERMLWKANRELVSGSNLKKLSFVKRTLLSPAAGNLVSYNGYDPLGNRGIPAEGEEPIVVEEIALEEGEWEFRNSWARFISPPTELLVHDSREGSKEGDIKGGSAAFTTALLEMYKGMQSLSQFDGDFISLQLLPLTAILRYWLSVQTAFTVVPVRKQWIDRSGADFFSEVDMSLVLARPEFVGPRENDVDKLEAHIHDMPYRYYTDPQRPQITPTHMVAIGRILAFAGELDAQVSWKKKKPKPVSEAQLRRLFRELHELHLTGELRDPDSRSALDTGMGRTDDLFSERVGALGQLVTEGEVSPLGEAAIGILFRRFHRANYPHKPNEHNVLGYIPVPDDEVEYRTIPLAQKYRTDLLVSRVANASASELKTWDTLDNYLPFVANLTDYFSRNATYLSVGWQIVQWLNRTVQSKVSPEVYISEFMHDSGDTLRFRQGCPVVSKKGKHGFVSLWTMDKVSWLPDVTFRLEKNPETKYMFDTEFTPLGKEKSAKYIRGYDSANGSDGGLAELFNTEQYPLDDANRYAVKGVGPVHPLIQK